MKKPLPGNRIVDYWYASNPGGLRFNPLDSHSMKFLENQMGNEWNNLIKGWDTASMYFFFSLQSYSDIVF